MPATVSADAAFATLAAQSPSRRDVMSSFTALAAIRADLDRVWMSGSMLPSKFLPVLAPALSFHPVSPPASALQSFTTDIANDILALVGAMIARSTSEGLVPAVKSMRAALSTATSIASISSIVTALRGIIALAPDAALPVCRDLMIVEPLAIVFDDVVPKDGDPLLRGAIVDLTCTIVSGAFLRAFQKGKGDDIADLFAAFVESIAQAGSTPGGLARHVVAHSAIVQTLRDMMEDQGCPLDHDRVQYLLDLLDAQSVGDPVQAPSETGVAVVGQDDPVAQLREVFPDFSEDYARACLAAFRFSYGETVTAILERRLPKRLANVKNTSAWRDPDRDRAEKAAGTSKTNTKSVQEPAAPKNVDEEIARFMALSGRVTIDEARAAEEDRIRGEDDVLVPGIMEASVLRERVSAAIECGYDDEPDDTFDAYERFDIGEGDVDEEADIDGDANDSKQDSHGQGSTRSNDDGRNRAFKDKHKARFANHNRKKRAAAKHRI
ncbi:CUE domain-containing protein [Plasmodiophora brassicae]